MSDQDEKDEKRGFKVQDRRRFSESGDVREDYRDAAAEPAAPPPATPPVSPDAAPESIAPGDDEGSVLELNFSTFVISLSTQALAHLGEIPHPLDNQLAVDLIAAKQLIDILGILREKTKGNLDQGETGLLDNVLYDLRLRYVERARSHS